MERKIGEIFNYQDNWYQCIENTGYGCIICHFNTHNNICCNNVLNIIGNCLPPYRKDYKSVVFRKLEKVGNPIMVENKSYQKIKVPDALCNNCAFHDNFSGNCKLSYYINHQLAYSCLKDEIFVEIKQNKENMEEKKLNLKEFNLEAAKAGKPIYTRDGRKARILCYDLKGVEEYPIVAAIETHDYLAESISAYDRNGRFDHDKENNNDLMILLEKKEGWINIYNRNTISTSKENCYIMTGVSVFKTKESAISYKDKDKEYIDTIKIEWEE